MSALEQTIQHYLSQVYVTLPCKVTKVHDDMYLDVRPLTYSNLEMPIIPRVPLGFLGNGDKYLKAKINEGTEIIVLFSQLDFSNFLLAGAAKNVDNSEMFNLTNAIALPFKIPTPGDNSPTIDFELIGNLDISGNITLKGDIIQTGNHTVTGTISASISMTAPAIAAGTGASPSEGLTVKGNSNLDGALTSTGTITGENVVGTTDVVGGGKSVATHTHSYTDDGSTKETSPPS